MSVPWETVLPSEAWTAVTVPLALAVTVLSD